MRRTRIAPHASLEEVRQLLHTEQDPIARTRLHAVFLAMQGKPQKEIAHTLGHSLRWVASVVSRWNKGGVEALKDLRHNNPGQRPKLTPDEVERVLAALKAPPSDGGLWTGPKLRAWVERELGKRLSLNPIYRLLHEMGFYLRVPRPQHRKGDEKAQVEFKKNSSKRLKKSKERERG